MSRIASRISRYRGRAALLAAVVGALALSGGAYAYFTTTGTGTGTEAVGTSSTLTVAGTASSTLYPGTSSTVNFVVDNPSSGHQRLGTISLSGVHACTGAGSSWNGSACSNGGTEQTSCESYDSNASSTTDDFSMPNVVANQDVGSGSGQTVTATGALAMNNLNASQNSCQAANITLSFTAS
jgi:hypothetical protein